VVVMAVGDVVWQCRLREILCNSAITLMTWRVSSVKNQVLIFFRRDIYLLFTKSW
jgi:hypothetical protein